MPITSINVGGLIALGFDKSSKYMLTVSHSGRGLYELGTWVRTSRDPTVLYPESGIIDGIGCLSGTKITLSEINYETGVLECKSPDGIYAFRYQEGMIEIKKCA